MDTMENLTNALREHFTESGLQVLTEAIDEQIVECYETLDKDPSNAKIEERLAVMSNLLAAIV